MAVVLQLGRGGACLALHRTPEARRAPALRQRVVPRSQTGSNRNDHHSALEQPSGLRRLDPCMAPCLRVVVPLPLEGLARTERPPQRGLYVRLPPADNRILAQSGLLRRSE